MGRNFAFYPRASIKSYGKSLKSRLSFGGSFKERILIDRGSGIGDIICTFPALIALRHRHPQARFFFRTQREFAPVVRMGGVVDEVVEDNYSIPVPAVWDNDFDVVYRPWLEDEKPTGRPFVHLVDDFCRTLDVQIKPDERQPRLHVSSGVREQAAARFAAAPRTGSGPWIGIHVGPSWPVREWPAEHWDALAVRLREELGATVVQFGADAYTGGGAKRAHRVLGAIDWVNLLSLEETAAAIQQCNLFIGIDSGLLHIAGAVGTPCLGLFGAIDPTLRLPPATPSLAAFAPVPCLACHHRKPRLHWYDGCPNEIRCMRELSPAQVMTQCSTLLQAIRG